MKNAIIFHGTGDSPNDYWFPYLRKELEKRGYEVWAPLLPNAENPNLKDWLSFILENGKITSETMLVGHSSGARIILSILENVDTKIEKAILVSGYAKPLSKDSNSEKGKEEFDWEKIKGKFQDIIFINSDNDHWECDDKQGRIMFDNLGGMQVILH